MATNPHWAIQEHSMISYYVKGPVTLTVHFQLQSFRQTV